ncbi:hypothetical protein HDU98_012347 [Podochytrium sp. JEL0797]|nr:hypothetical protein HDU98_012347 [Podochytrium sp. JEL0797]
MAEQKSPHFIDATITLPYLSQLLHASKLDITVLSFVEIPTGWNNKAIKVSTADNQTLILRLSNASSWPKSKVENEVAALQFVAINLPTLRIPKLMGYGFNFSTPENIKEVHWMLMECIEGEMLEGVWRTLSLDQKLVILGELRETIRILQSKTFDVIGGWTLTETGGPEVGKYWDGGFKETSEADFLLGRMAENLQDLRSLKNAPASLDVMLDRVEASKAQIESMLDNLEPSPIVLFHGDFAFRNMMVKMNSETGMYEISGLLDWEWCGTRPAWVEVLDDWLEEEMPSDEEENKWIREEMKKDGFSVFENLEGYEARSAIYCVNLSTRRMDADLPTIEAPKQQETEETIQVLDYSRTSSEVFGAMKALSALPKYNFFTRGNASITPPSSTSLPPPESRGQCQFCESYYKLQNQLLLNQNKRWFRSSRRRLWFAGWKLWHMVAGWFKWIWISLTTVWLFLWCRSLSGSRIEFLAMKKAEIGSRVTLNEVVVVATKQMSTRESEPDAVTTALKRIDMKTPCRVEQRQIQLFTALMTLGAAIDSAPALIQYAAKSGHLSLLTVLIDAMPQPKDSHADITSNAWMLRGTLLAESVRRQNYRLLSHLCTLGAALPENRSYRALELAVNQRDTRALQLLVDNGARTTSISNDPDLPDPEPENGLLISKLRAAMIRRVFGIPVRDGGTTQLILEGLIRAHKSPTQAAFVEYAENLLVPILVEIGSPALLRAIWERGVDLDMNDSMSLYISLICGHWKVIRFLTREVATIRIRDLEDERSRLKSKWRLKKKVRGSFLVELVGVWLGLLWRRKSPNRTQVVPDVGNSSSVTFVPIHESTAPIPTESDSLEVDLDTRKRRFYKPERGIRRFRNIRFKAALRPRRLFALLLVILLHVTILSWFFYNVVTLLIGFICFQQNVAQNSGEIHYLAGSYYQSSDGSTATYYFQAGSSDSNGTYESAVYITGWCAAQLGTNVIDSDFWFKNSAVAVILLIAVLIAERTMPLYGICLSLLEVCNWLLKRALLTRIVQMKRNH